MRVDGRVPRLALLVVLVGRAVALELSTGFRFDSPMASKPR